MGNNTFKHEYHVDFSGISNKGTLKISGIANFFQSLGTLHSEAAGFPVEELVKENRGWVLLSWHIYIDSLPHDGDTVLAETWAESYKRAQANRDFCLRDATGNKIAWATSRWTLMDTQRRRPARMDAEFFAAYEIEGRPEVVADANYTIKAPETAHTPIEDIFVAKRRDTDSLGHVNNAVYIDWLIDAVPDNIYESCELKDLVVNYKKECRRGDTVKSICLCDGKTLYISFVDANAPTTVYCETRSIWE